MTTSPAPHPIAAPDVPQAAVQQTVARQRAQAAVEKSVEKLRWLLAHPDEAPHTPATPGELKEQRHWLHDADADSTIPAIRADLTKHVPEEGS